MGKLAEDVEIKSSAEKYWGAMKDFSTLFPKIFPEQYKSIEILEGDGHQVGSVRVITYAEGMPFVKVGKEKIEVSEEESKLVAYSVIGGDLTDYFPTFKISLQIIPKGDGAVVKWSVEYEKLNEEVPEPTAFKDYAIQAFKDLDAYLLKA